MAVLSRGGAVAARVAHNHQVGGSNPSPATMLNRTLRYSIYILLFVLPFQTRYIFSDNVNPFAITSIYVFDLVFIVVALLWVWYWYRTPALHSQHVPFYLGMTIAVLAICSSYFAGNREVTWFYLLHFLMGIWLIAIIATAPIKFTHVLWILFSQSLIQALFSIYEFAWQLVPPNRYLGMAEQLPETSGVTVVVTAAGRFLRSYALMPHPNIAAGVIVLGLIAAYWLPVKKTWLLLAVGLTTLGLVLTFSRSGLLAYAIVLIVLLINKLKNLPTLTVSAGVLLVCGLYFFPLLSSRLDTSIYTEQLSVMDRSEQLHQALQLLPRYWPQGTGLGQYTLLANFGNTAQPLHFVPGLILLELGIVTGLLWYSLISVSWKQAGKQLLTHPAFYLGLVLMITGCFDHYPFTNISIFWLWCVTLGLLYIPQHKPKMTETTEHHP